MEILLKDGVKYAPYEYKDEAEFEKIVFEHYKEIFAKNTILMPKQKIKMASGIGTIPDAFVLSIDEKRWYILEVELSAHPLYQHIVAQIAKFCTGARNTATQKNLVKVFHNEIKNDPWKYALFQSNGISEIFKFVSDVIDSTPQIVIVIDEESHELNDVCDALPFHSRVIVFKTSYRENVGLGDHIHAFESLIPEKELHLKEQREKIKEESEIARKREAQFPIGESIRVIDLIKSGYISPGDRIYRTYKEKRHVAEILNDGRIKLEDGTIVNSLSRAARHISKKSENGWIIWRYIDKNGKEWLMSELRDRLQGGQ